MDYESGLGSMDGRDYFNSVVNDLEMAYQNAGQDNEDPSFDLQNMGLAIRTSSPIRNSNSSNQAIKRPDPTLEEVELIANEIKRKSLYSDKLTAIMLKNLENTLGLETYRLFQNGRLPKTWIPIVRMNSDNCPYIEFLIKSDVADEDPASQLSDYTNNHLAYCHFILEHVQKSATRRVMATSTPLKDVNQSRPSNTSQHARQQLQLHQHPQVQQRPQAQQRTQVQERPQVQKQRPKVQKQQPDQDLNQSLVRRQPNRSCKMNSSYSDRSISK